MDVRRRPAAGLVYPPGVYTGRGNGAGCPGKGRPICPAGRAVLS